MTQSTAKIVDTRPPSHTVVQGDHVVIEVTLANADSTPFGPGDYELVAVRADADDGETQIACSSCEVVSPSAELRGDASSETIPIHLSSEADVIQVNVTIPTDHLPEGTINLRFRLSPLTPTKAAETRVRNDTATSSTTTFFLLASDQKRSNDAQCAETAFKNAVRAVEPIRVVSSKDSVATNWTDDVTLYAVIKAGSASLSFSKYAQVIDEIMCAGSGSSREAVRYTDVKAKTFLPFNNAEAYRYLVAATEAFVAVNSAIDPAQVKEVLADPQLQQLLANLNARDVPGVLRGPNPQTSWEDRYAQQYLVPLQSPDLQINPYLNLIRSRIGGQIITEGDRTQNPEKIVYEGILARKLSCSLMIELIWSYWHEQGMLAQTMFALRDRFQNRRTRPGVDPLAGAEIAYVGRLPGLLFDHFRNEQHRLSVEQRAYEYDHHYGLGLQGAAVPVIQSADSRARFLEAFHNLLGLSVVFFREDDDTNRKADAFPILNALKEVHFLLSEGAHNQYGDLPTTSRIEMLIEQWLLSRPEMHKVLPSREMIAYPEPWMGPVDAMKTIQGWTNTSVMYFHDLANFGEQILLSIRFNNWSTITDRAHAANWARVWRSELQGYMHAYRTVTGVDLTTEAKDPGQLAERNLDPSIHLQRRFAEQRQAGLAVRGAGRLPGVPTAARIGQRQAALPPPRRP